MTRKPKKRITKYYYYSMFNYYYILLLLLLLLLLNIHNTKAQLMAIKLKKRIVATTSSRVIATCTSAQKPCSDRASGEISNVASAAESESE